MNEDLFVQVIREQTARALWEVKNVMDCFPDELWEKQYCGMPAWKHMYHMLHSLDQWFINPKDKLYTESSIHVKDLNNLDVVTTKRLTREEINHYYSDIKKKITDYLEHITDPDLLVCPENCKYNRFTLILAQHRHLHSHMGMLMGFTIDDTGLWPRVLGLTSPFPTGNYEKYF